MEIVSEKDAVSLVTNRKELFLRACRCQPVERVPVWIMRQAGRYLPEYQAIRAHHSFLEICKTPELATEVSMQPFRIIGVDAVIVFSDILIVAEAMGLPLAVPDDGPVLSNPIRDVAAIRALRKFDPNGETRFVGDAIRSICREAGPTVPVIGFAAAPWTLACYMIEGRTRGDISLAKRMVATEPAMVRELLDRIADATIGYVKSQIEAGASVIQLFDTWAGELRAEQYAAFELPATQKIFRAIADSGVAKILYAKSSSHLIEQLGKAGSDVVSVDWRTDLTQARAVLGDSIAIQGNVDPSLLLTTEDAVRDAARAAVTQTGGFGHILNLGHGILPTTNVANARAFVEAGQAVRFLARVPAAQA
jgi:uroporphyrinogen decarboxylase